MGRFATLSLFAACSLSVVAGVGAPVSAQPIQDTLFLSEAFSLAEEFNPGLDALRHGAEAAGLREPAASTLPDPMLQFGVMNFGIPDLNADMAMSMAPSIQLSQTFPWPGKLSRQADIARHDREIALARAGEASWSVRARVASVFFQIWSLDRRLEVMRSTLELLHGFREVALAMYGTGSGQQADVLRADVEIARTDGEIERMVGERFAAVAVLNGLLDRPVDTPIDFAEPGAIPSEVPPREVLEQWAADYRPALAEVELGVGRAAAVASRAQREIWPDLRVGISYGQRDRGAGTERMASAMVGVTLPVFAGSRQNALRDAAFAEERVAEARRGQVRADVSAAIGRLLADLEASRTLVDLYRDEVVPQARSNVESAFSAYRVGNVDFLTLVDAQTTANRYEAELFALVARFGTTVAEVESAVGRPLPSDGPQLRISR